MTNTGAAVLVAVPPGHIRAVRANLVDVLRDEELRAARALGATGLPS